MSCASWLPDWFKSGVLGGIMDSEKETWSEADLQHPDVAGGVNQSDLMNHHDGAVVTS